MATLHNLKLEKVIKSFWFLALKIPVDYFREIGKLLVTSGS